MIVRTFTTIDELRTMIDGYTKLFSAAPQEMKLELIGRRGYRAAIDLGDGSELNSAVYVTIESVGRAYITVAYTGDDNHKHTAKVPVQRNMTYNGNECFRVTFD